MSASVVLVFAKAPEAGRVKTRLLPLLSPQQAARIHRACLGDTVRQVARVPGCRKWLRVAAPFDRAMQLATTLELNGKWRVGVQRGQDLGARLHEALASSLRSGYRRVVVVGTDTPWLGSERILRAIRLLSTADVVLGPTADGGYYLVGARRLVPQMFRDIPWGTAQVFESTLKALRKARASYRLLPPDFDLDRPEDLRRAARLLRRDADRAPALARLLAKQGTDWDWDAPSRSSRRR
jgi:rSAM/selenodomain-associated transferase 1